MAPKNSPARMDFPQWMHLDSEHAYRNIFIGLGVLALTSLGVYAFFRRRRANSASQGLRAESSEDGQPSNTKGAYKGTNISVKKTTSNKQRC